MGLAFIEHYTYEDYKQWEGDWELIDGQAYAMAPAPIKRHQSLTARISAQLVEAYEECQECEVLIEEDYIVDVDTVLRPDIAVVCNDFDPNYITKAPEIIVEIVSPKTALRDEKIKFALYERERVKYYILVYPDTLKAKIYRHNGERYIKEGDFFDQIYFFEDILCKPNIDFAKVFRKYKKENR